MGTAFVTWNGLHLRPCRATDLMALEALPRNVPLKVEPKQPRNTKQHRLFYAFATLVADALNQGPSGSWTQDKVVTHIKLATGHVTLMKLGKRDAARLGTDIAALPASISFAKMDGVAFSDFMHRAFEYVRDELAPWIEDSPAWPQVREILGQSGYLEAA